MLVWQLTSGSVSTLSVATTCASKSSVAVPSAPASTVTGAAGTVVKTGAVWSVTVTMKVAADSLFESSVAVQVTVVEPSGNSEPELGTQARLGAGSALSVAVTE